MINKTKILFFIAAGAFLSSCTAIKTASVDVERDPVYATKEDVKAMVTKANVEAERIALDQGESARQGKRSGNANSKYDYMPATSYAQRFNRTGNSFFLNGRAQENFRHNQYNSEYNQNLMGMGYSPMGYGGMFNPYNSMNVGCNPWSNPWNDPWTNYYMMQANAYPFFTYNPYMYSYGLLNNRYDPWMMNSFYNPYFNNPYYFYTPYGNNSFRNTYQTASRPNRNSYTNSRRTSTVGSNTSNAGSRTSSYGNNNNNNNSNNNSSGSNANSGGNTFSSGGSGTTRGGYNTNSRATRGTSTTRGTGRR